MKTINSAIAYLDMISAKIPTNVAIADAEEEYTFEELRKMSRAVGTFLLRNKYTNCNISILLPKKASAVISFFGCLYSGNVYVPIDCNDADERIVKIISKVSSPIVITDKKNADRLHERGINTVLYENIDKEVTEDALIEETLKKVYDLMPAYIMHTSGSTGEPKGVVIPHRGIVDFIDWITSYMKLDEKSVIALQSPFHFDASVFDIYACIAVGAKLVIMPDVLAGFPAKVPQFIEENHITCIFWVPGLLADIANSGALKQYKMKELKLCTFIGEVMPAKQLNMWIRENPDREYINLYGPTEATVACSAYRICNKLSDTDIVPIGKASQNKKIIILDKNDKLTKTGEKGEICILGSGLALGYYGDKKKTDEAFVQNPLHTEYEEIIYRTGDFGYTDENGDIVFSGRKDSQVKVHGIRIELGEVENAANMLEGAEKTCALLKDKKLFLFMQTQKRHTQRQLKQMLKEHLPKYMIPDEIYELSAFPINKNGKTDRKELLRKIQ